MLSYAPQWRSPGPRQLVSQPCLPQQRLRSAPLCIPSWPWDPPPLPLLGTVGSRDTSKWSMASLTLCLELSMFPPNESLREASTLTHDPKWQLLFLACPLGSCETPWTWHLPPCSVPRWLSQTPRPGAVALMSWPFTDLLPFTGGPPCRTVLTKL